MEDLRGTQETAALRRVAPVARDAARLRAITAGELAATSDRAEIHAEWLDAEGAPGLAYPSSRR